MLGGSTTPPRRAYQGPDRRSRTPWPDPVSPGPALLAAAAVSLVLVPLITLVAGIPAAEALVHHTGRQACGLLLAGAGVLCAVRWRVTGEAADGHLARALILLGALPAPLAAAGELVHDTPAMAAASPLTTSVVLAAALLASVAALRTEDVDASLHPLRRLAVAAAGTVAVALLLGWLLAVTGLADRSGLWVAVHGLLSLGCLAVAVAVLVRFRTAGRSWQPWFAATLLLAGVAAACRACGHGGSGDWEVAAASFDLVAGSVALLGAGTDLRRTLDRQRQDLRRLSAELRGAEDDLRDLSHRHEEQLHDIRSTLAVVRRATATLGRPGVAAAVGSELRRLERLTEPFPDDGAPAGRIDPVESVERVQQVDLAELLTPLVTTARAAGAKVEAYVSGEVLAAPADLAAVLHNLVANAVAHGAPPVVVHSEPGTAGEIHLHVDDHGPGVPAELLPLLTARGVQLSTAGPAPAAPGHGLGLCAAERLLAAQGGRLELSNLPGGGLRATVVLPAAGVPRQLQRSAR